jgi:D-alanyl-D-alanine carboxypeptidase/D-alanyl-D-alanine-endopeptidase (penicillin-binding protein 4)
MVYDLTDHRTLFSRRAGVGRPPASLEKLYTSIALLTLLGTDIRLHTDVLGTGHLSARGAWDGNLYLRGDGDPTFGDGAFNKIYELGHGPTAVQIAGQLHRDGIRSVTGRIFADESRFDPDRGGPATGNQPDLPDYGGELSALVFDHGATSGRLTPGEFAVRQLARTMRSRHIRIRASTLSVRTPPDARRLATVASPPLSTMLALMDVPSDDLFADLFAKQLGYRFAGQGTLAVGAAQISHVIDGLYGVRARILDGSGLDRSDRSTPAGVVALLRKAWHTPAGAALERALPVIGETGTVQSIAQRTAAQGRCVAKTGTLDDVTNLAGYCAARGGKTLAFALFLDGPENWEAYGMLTRMVAAIAAY